MSKQTHIKVSGSWKEVKSVWRKVSGSWVKDVMPYYKVGGEWRECMYYNLYEGIMTVGDGLLSNQKGWGLLFGSMNPEIEEGVATYITQTLYTGHEVIPHVRYETDYPDCTIISINGIKVGNGTIYPENSDVLPDIGQTCDIILKSRILYEGVMTVGSGSMFETKGWGHDPVEFGGEWGSMDPEIGEGVATYIYQRLNPNPFGEDPYITYETDYPDCTIISINGWEAVNGAHYHENSDNLPDIGETCNIILK